MEPSESSENRGEATIARIPQCNQEPGDHQRLEIHNHRRMEIHPLKFADMLQQVRIGDVFNHVLMEVPAIRIDKGQQRSIPEK